jgi:hypothetical protein
VLFLRRTNAGRGTQFVRHRGCLRENGKQPQTTPQRPAFPLCSTTRSLAADGRRDRELMGVLWQPQDPRNLLCPSRDIGNRTYRRHGLHFFPRRGRKWGCHGRKVL